MDDDITFYLNRRGTRKATFRGYDYCKDREYKERMYWKCTNRLCGGRIITLESIVVKETEHNLHGPDLAEVKKNLSMARIIPELCRAPRAIDDRVSRSSRPKGHFAENKIVQNKNYVYRAGEKDKVMHIEDMSKQINENAATEMCVHNNPCTKTGQAKVLHQCVRTNGTPLLRRKLMDDDKKTVWYDCSWRDLHEPNADVNMPCSYAFSDHRTKLSNDISDVSSTNTENELDYYSESDAVSKVDNIEELNQADLHIRLCMAMFQNKDDVNSRISSADKKQCGSDGLNQKHQNTELDEEEVKFLHDLLKYLNDLPNQFQSDN